MSQNHYIGYQNMLTTVTTGITQLTGVCQDLGMHEQAGSLSAAKERLQNHVFSVGIMGEFRRGKSTVINALLGQEIVPSDIIPTSATLNYVRWGSEKFAEIHFKDGTVKRVPVEELSRYVTKLTAEYEEVSATVDHAAVYYPCSFCQNGVQIVDTPGLNDEDRMDAISENVIPSLDAIIMVVTADSPFSKSEAEFVRSKVMASDLGRIIFVVNKFDTVRKKDRARLLEDIKGRIQVSVLEKMAAVYGRNSREYDAAREKLGEIRLLGISARDALDAKLEDDEELLAESGYPAFEEMLSRLLTEERGMLEMIHPVNKIRAVSSEALDTIRMRSDALQIQTEDFQKIQEESRQTIQENRKKKKEEIKLLKSKGKTLYADLLPELDGAYGRIREGLLDYVEKLPITDANLANEAALKAFSDKVGGQINKELKEKLSIETERLMARISDQLGEDVQDLEAFARDLTADMKGVQTKLSLASVKVGNGTSFGSNVATAAIDGALLMASALATGSALPGIGGLIAGFREHGVKGAITGGLAGCGIGVAAAFLASGLGIVGVPFVLITGLASTFGGKAITNLLFGKTPKTQSVKNSTQDIRRQLLKSTENTMDSLRNEKTLENWLKTTCTETYDKVADNIDQEWENTLSTMEHTLSKIEADLARSEADKARAEKEMLELAEMIGQVLKDIKPIHEKLTDKQLQMA